jgi:hypothetical protein
MIRFGVEIIQELKGIKSMAMSSFNKRASYPRDQREIMEHIGETLLSLQSAEMCVSMCLQWVFPLPKIKTFDDLYELNKKESKATLGMLLSELRTRVHVQPEFDALLKRFLKNRNQFVHGLFCKTDYIIISPVNIKRGHVFLYRLRQDIWEIENVFGSYFQLWSKTAGLEEYMRKRNPAVLDSEDVKSVRKGFKYLLHPKHWDAQFKWRDRQRK